MGEPLKRGTELDPSNFEVLSGYSASIWLLDPEYRRSLVGREFAFNGREFKITEVTEEGITAQVVK